MSKSDGAIHTRRVLVVDDDMDFLSIARRVFERHGAEVTTFIDARHAIGAIRSRPGAWDIVITDYLMFGQTGMDVAHAVREHQPGLPCVLVTDLISDSLIERARSARVHRVCRKPFRAEQLIALIDPLPERKNARLHQSE